MKQFYFLKICSKRDANEQILASTDASYGACFAATHLLEPHPWPGSADTRQRGKLRLRKESIPHTIEWNEHKHWRIISSWVKFPASYVRLLVQSFVGAKFMTVTCEVENIHKLGGSILVSDRGNPPHSEIAKARGRSTWKGNSRRWLLEALERVRRSESRVYVKWNIMVTCV